MKYKQIIWDWNGTLFNDIDVCIETMNELLNKRNIKPIQSRKYYREIFCFPVIDYYLKLGFDFKQESFKNVADEYIESYHKKCMSSKLMPGTKEVIKSLNDLQIKQTVISASEQNSLNKQIKPFNINHLFEDIIGIEDNFARSKLSLAKDYLLCNHLNNNEVLFIGDTVHDYEVSNCLKCDCVLISWGHQSINILKNSEVPIINNFDELIDLIVT